MIAEYIYILVVFSHNSSGGICPKVNEVYCPLAFFKEYLQYGYYPFYLKDQMDYYTTIEQITNPLYTTIILCSSVLPMTFLAVSVST